MFLWWLSGKISVLRFHFEGRLSELFCAALCTTVVYNDAHTHMPAVVTVGYVGSFFVFCLVFALV